MPRVSDDLLKTAVFMYPSVEDAQSRTGYGGSGFVVGYEYHADDAATGSVHYVVTNSHVINQGRSRVASIMDNAGKTNIVSLDGWATHPDGDDVAVAPVPVGLIPAVSVPPELFMTEDIFRKHAYGPGDDVTMTGRFVGLDHKVRNATLARFGHLATNEVEQVESEYGLKQDSFLCEMRSLPGYSGSAVFIDSGPFGMTHVPNERVIGRIWFLGIDWGHIPRLAPVLEPIEGTSPTEYKQVENYIVKENTGMAAVVPAWKIAELLEEGTVKKQRDDAEREWRAAHQVKSPGVSLDTNAPPLTKEEFETALRKVSRRKPSPPDEGTSGTSE